MSQAKRALGARGEELVAAWYEQHGYHVLARNWRCRAGELDLIVARGRAVVFCEVKARTSDAFGVPAEAVTRTKQIRLRRLAATWLDTAAPWPAAELRFDVASVLGGAVEIIEGAF
jgi:putative endonuclease